MNGKNDEEWLEKLTPEQYAVARLGGTEFAFTGEYTKEKAPGTYKCVCCDTPLFRSEAKFDSDCGWPCFFEPIDAAKLVEIPDKKRGLDRTEIRCENCGAHLGHVYKDGPPPTGRRFRLNSVCLDLERDE